MAAVCLGHIIPCNFVAVASIALSYEAGSTLCPLGSGTKKGPGCIALRESMLCVSYLTC